MLNVKLTEEELEMVLNALNTMGKVKGDDLYYDLHDYIVYEGRGSEV